MIINGENDQKLFIFEPKWYIFGKKWWKFMQKSMFKIAHIWMKWLKSNWFYQCKKWSNNLKKLSFSSIFMQFYHMYVDNKSTFVDILHAENWKKLGQKTCQKWKIKQFSKESKIVNSTPNHVLNSGKNSYRVF